MSKTVNALLAMNGVQTAETSVEPTQALSDVGQVAPKLHLDVTPVRGANAQRSGVRGMRGALAKSRGLGSLTLVGVVLDATRPDARERYDYSFGAGQAIPLPPGSGG